MRTRIKWLQFYLCLFIASLSFGMLVGCALTVTPSKVAAKQASFDVGQQNSGIIALKPDKSAVVTPHFRDRYNGLVATYGNRFTPALKPDAGIAPQGDVFTIDAEHLVKFLTMNRWKKEGK